MARVPERDVEVVRRFCEGRVPAELRDAVRVEVSVRGTSATIFECRPPWTERQEEWSRVKVAQLRFDPGTGSWTLFCADRNGRWHLYPEVPPGSIAELLVEIDDDPTGIFWG